VPELMLTSFSPRSLVADENNWSPDFVSLLFITEVRLKALDLERKPWGSAKNVFNPGTMVLLKQLAISAVMMIDE